MEIVNTVTSGRVSWLLAASVVVLAACGYVPTRFADRSAATTADDRRPIGKPSYRALLKPLYYSDIYIRRAAVDALNPQRSPYAGDVNALDEVVASSWHVGSVSDGAAMGDYQNAGPPEPPLTSLPLDLASSAEGVVMRDARGVLYEIWPSRGVERIASAHAVCSRLWFLLGYHTPEVYPLSDAPDALTAIAFPSSRYGGPADDIGATPTDEPRDDDPNDRVDHRDRRTLRVLPIFAAWLGYDDIEPEVLRDVYVGRPGAGHVEHQLLFQEPCFGLDAILDAAQRREEGQLRKQSALYSLLTLGLGPVDAPTLPEEPWGADGLFDTTSVPRELDKPFEPADRLMAADALWALRQLYRVSDDELRWAVGAGNLPTDLGEYLVLALQARRKLLAARVLEDSTAAGSIRLEPDGLHFRAAPRNLGASSVYRVRVVNEEGESQAYYTVRAGTDGMVHLVADNLAPELGYVVIRLFALDEDGDELPAVEVHVRRSDGDARVVGIMR